MTSLDPCKRSVYFPHVLSFCQSGRLSQLKITQISVFFQSVPTSSPPWWPSQCSFKLVTALHKGSQQWPYWRWQMPCSIWCDLIHHKEVQRAGCGPPLLHAHPVPWLRYTKYYSVRLECCQVCCALHQALEWAEDVWDSSAGRWCSVVATNYPTWNDVRSFPNHLTIHHSFHLVGYPQ